MVGIYGMSRDRTQFLCGGTLISDCWVLTAASCFRSDDNETNDLQVVTGDTERFVNEYTETTYGVEKVLIHPEFDQVSFNNDIALLKLHCNVKYSSFVRKACLPTSSDVTYYQQGTRCLSSGWGSAGLSTTLRLMSTTVAHSNAKDCRKYTKRNVTTSMRCVCNGTKASVTCYGDTGGPLFCKRTNSSSYVVIGIGSWGEACAQPGKYGIFTKVYSFMKWITSMQLRFPKCNNECPDSDVKIV